MTRRAISAAAVSVALLVASLTLSGCSSSPEKEGTSVSDANGAVIIASNGTRTVAAPGVRVPQGAVVVTGPDGAATLDTGGRIVYLGRSAEYVVGSGVTGELRRGSAVVDDRAGPALRLLAGALSVNDDGSTWRVERGFSTRVGVFSGSVQVAMGGRSQPLPALYQVVVAGLQLPAKTPLVLRDDDAERRVALQLVDDDVALTSEAQVLNRSHDGRALVRLASDVGLTPVSAASTSGEAMTSGPRSETALPVAIARAAVGGGATVPEFAAEYTRTRALRAAGGSWGVVAHLVGTDARATNAAINLLLAAPGKGSVDALAGGTTGGSAGGDTSGATGGNSGGPTGGNDTGGTTSGASGGDTGGSTGGSGGPTPRPSPTPGGDPVNDLVNTVSGLLGASPSPSPQPNGHTGAPTPVTCLLLVLACS